MKKTRILALAAAAALLVCLLSACGGPGPSDSGGDTAGGSGTHHVTIEVQDYGTISLELDGDAAPLTVENFMNLAESGFYDGLTFHRVAAGFVIQGGQAKDADSAPESIVGEFAANGHENSISHVRGVISMARATDYDSASSQFFIMQADNTTLDGSYAAFGHVTEGMDVVDAICAEVPVNDPVWGWVDEEYQPVITKVTVID